MISHRVAMLLNANRCILLIMLMKILLQTNFRLRNEDQVTD